MKPFPRVYIEISNVCNLQCSFCPEVVREKGFMTPEFFDMVTDQIAPLTDQVTFHLMGDPLIHPKLSELIDICEKKKLSIFLVTNGVLLKNKNVSLFMRPTFQQINFSFHSFPNNFKDRDPTGYLESIFEFTKRAFQERPELYINYRLWNLQDVKSNRDENLRMLEKVENHFGFRFERNINVRSEKSFKIKNRLYLHFDTEFVWPGIDLPVLGTRGRCYGLTSHFGILVDGTVVPCCLDKEGVIALGNLKKESIIAILEGQMAKNLKSGFQKGHLIEDLCQRCNYIERFGREGRISP